jgi:endogenous inhibitor of DNA gyrase (YacG/DUF329 family)
MDPVTTLPCPTCGRPVLIAADDRPAAFPFCCPRCRDRDLGAWADGRHAIPGRDLHELLSDRDPA